jgi:hypothetical protein
VTTRSIFQKVCPSCMATVALDTRQCSCGQHFDHDNTDANLSSEEIRLKAEQLYESYLAARAEQAANAVKAAQAAFAADPSNPEKSERVADTIGEAQTAAAALSAQSARIVEMKQTMRPSAPPPKPAPASAAPKKRMTPRKSAAAEPARTVRKPAPVVDVTASARAKRHSKPAVPMAAKNPPAPVAAPVPKKPEVAQAEQTAAPNPAFRQAQAAKAEKILRTVRVTAPTPQVKKQPVPVLPVPEKKITPVVAVSTGTNSAPRLYKAEKSKDCPNCTASVDSGAASCRCGYEFPSSRQLIPPLAMSDEERAEFAKLFNHP